MQLVPGADRVVRHVCIRCMFVTQAAVKRKQKSLSREQQDRFDEAHAPKFKSTFGPVKCSRRWDEKRHLNTTRK